MSALETGSLLRAADQSQPVSKLSVARPEYNLPLGYLRAFVTVLVLAHHAVLAYHPFAPAPPSSLLTQPRWWQAFPVTDSVRWSGFALLVSFNDIFFMSLMFFLSGLFVWQSLERKGSGSFLRGRFVRLGLPFVVAAALVAPLAYYPAYLQTGRRGLSGFWHEWLALGNWPAGPAWFVWVLLAFDLIAAALFVLTPRRVETLGRRLSGASRRPVVFFGFLAAVSALVYVPMALAFNPLSWTAFGPFFFQTSRILHYLLYFLVAAGIGAYGLKLGLAAPDGRLARKWVSWMVTALLAFGVALAGGLAALTAKGSVQLWGTIAGIGFSLSCAASSLALLALFLRFVKVPRPVFDSLRDNSYGMYLIHYACVSWLQYAVLKVDASAPVKGLTVFLGTLVISWSVTAALRRIPAIARII